MELQGKVIAVLEPRTGDSRRNPGEKWMSQEYVIETHDQYPRKMVFNVWGADRIQRFNVQLGQEVTVLFDIDAREWNGRWFNDIRAYDVRPFVASPAPAAEVMPPFGEPAPAAPVANANDPLGALGDSDDNSGLPF